MISFSLFIKLLFVVFLIIVDIILLKSFLRGAPFAPTKPATVQLMLKSLQIVPGTRAVDLGSGDGRLVIALAQAGAEAHGYETNPFLVWLSRFKIRRAGLHNTAFIHRQSFWQTSMQPYTVVTVFGIPYIMKELADKLRKELKPNAVIASNTFSLPGWQVNSTSNGVHMYRA